MTPAEGFRFTRKYAEMRRLGTAPAVLPYAVLFGYLELARQVPNLQSVFRQFSTQTAGDALLAEVVCGDLEEAKVQSAVLSAEFCQAFLAFANNYFQRLGIDAEVANPTNTLQAIVSSLGINVTLDYKDDKEYLIQGGEGGLVTLGMVQETCFLLYPHYTAESFCRLPCNHLQLKFEVMRQFQGAAGVKAVSLQSPELGAALLCSACELQYDPELHWEFALQVIQSLNSPTPAQPPSSLNAGVWGNTYVCWICFQTISREKYVSYCSCPFTVCESCFVVNNFTANWDKCPKCKSNLTYNSETARLTEEPLLQSLLTPSNYVLQPVKAKYCSICREVRDLFQATENVNSWRCITCSGGDERKEASTAAPLSESDLSGRVAKLNLEPEDECDDENQQGISYVPLLAVSASKDSHQQATFYECCQCKKVIDEKVLEVLENHLKCKVCYECILANFKKCPYCDVAYDERESKAIRQLTGRVKSREEEINSQPCARCSFCSKLITAAVHRCADAKSSCVPCFLHLSLDTIHGPVVQCKLCHQQAEEPFRTAVLTLQSDCSTCHIPITINNIGHACMDNRLICQQCIESPQDEQVDCSTCATTFQNRLLLR